MRYPGLVLRLPLADWPIVDQQAWTRAIALGTRLDAGGLGEHWAESTKGRLRSVYGRWLVWSLENPHTPTDLIGPHAVTQVRVKAYVQHLSDTVCDATVIGYLTGLAAASKAMYPCLDLDWLWRLIRRLTRSARPSTRKDGRVVTVRELYALGMALMSGGRPRSINKPLQDAIDYRDGLAIALLAARPFRRSNFTAIQLGRHLVQHVGGWCLSFKSSETKTCRPIQVPFPSALVPALNTYLGQHRPRLLAGGPVANRHTVDHLWVSSYGGPLASAAFYSRIILHTSQRFGHAVNPHLFRDCAATSIATDDPEHAYITAGILGHATLATSERYYNHAVANKAVREYRDLIASIRRKARR